MEQKNYKTKRNYGVKNYKFKERLHFKIYAYTDYKFQGGKNNGG